MVLADRLQLWPRLLVTASYWWLGNGVAVSSVAILADMLQLWPGFLSTAFRGAFAMALKVLLVLDQLVSYVAVGNMVVCGGCN